MGPDICRPTIAGLTGGIASGKSTVAAMLADAGARIIDADRTLEDYGLRVPGAEFKPAHGEIHRRNCLETLALFEGGQS